MRDLFQELYNKVLSLFNSSKEEINPTKSLAVNRLKTVLMQDRVGFSERAIQMLKEELIATVTKYMEIDTENFELQIDAMDNSKTVLNLTIPVLRPKTDDEIDANIKEQQLKTQRKAQEIVKELEGLIKERTQALIDGKIDHNEGSILPSIKAWVISLIKPSNSLTISCAFLFVINFCSLLLATI